MVETWLSAEMQLPEVGSAAAEQGVDGKIALEMDVAMWRELGATGLAPAKVISELKFLQRAFSTDEE